MNELISVIIPVYNVERYLARCLASVCASRYSALEIICIDDGSTDGSSAMLDDWAKKDSRIRVVHTKNNGLSMARNAGLEIASGAYIAFIDSDDYVSEYYFELLLKELLAHNAGIAVCGHRRTYTSEDTSRVIPPYSVTVMTKEEMLASHKIKSYACGKLYRRTLLKSVRFRPDLKIEDAPFNMDIARENGDYQTVYLDAQMYFYYFRPGSLMSAIGAEAYLQLHTHYAECAKTEKDPAIRQMLLTDSVKRGLTAELRYWMNRETDKYRMAKATTLSAAWKCRKRRLVLCTFAAFPMTYKMYLTRKDPTLRGWRREKR